MTNNQQAEALRQWLKYPTWSVREGLLLLAGIDPRRADCLHFSEDCTELEASADPESLPPVGGVRVGGPTWCRLGSPERIESGPDGSLHIVGPVCAPDDILLILTLMEHWHRTPGHDGVKMATPAQFIAVAERAGLPPTWLEAASLAGLLPHQPEPPASASPAALPGASPAPAAPAAPDSASAPAAGLPGAVAQPLPRQRHQEAEILRVLRELGHDPAALPARPPGRSGAKAEAWHRLAWKKERRGVFDGAWERLRGTGEIGGG